MCPMCPHAVIWRKYYIAKLSGTKRTAALTADKSPRKLAFIWGNASTDICRTGLPPSLSLRSQTRETFKQFEKARSVIMATHHELADAHKRILLRLHRLEHGQKVSHSGPYLYKWLALVSEAADARISISRRIWALRLDSSQGESRTTL